MIAFYGSTKIDGPQKDVEFILSLINEKELSQVRRSSRIEFCEDFGRCNCLKGYCLKGFKT